MGASSSCCGRRSRGSADREGAGERLVIRRRDANAFVKSATPCPIVLLARSLGLGGSERQLTEVAMALDRRFAPTVVCFDAAGVRGDDLRRAGVRILELPVRSFVSPASAPIAWRFVRLLRGERVALVHPFDVPTVLFAAPAARIAHVPVVLSSQRGDRRLFPRGYQRALNVTDRLVDGIVVNSDYIRCVLVEHFRVRDDRIHTCRNGVDTTVFHPEGRGRRPELGPCGAVVGIVAALRCEKSIETLIDAFARIQNADARFVVVGEGPERDVLIARAHQAGIAARSLFVPASLDVASWYRSIDVFVLPSTNESFSNSLMEAMACGCAVIGSNVGGNPELVRDSDNGLLFEAGNAADLAEKLQTAVGNPDLRRRLAAAAVRTIHGEYTREAAARRVAELYEGFLNRSVRH